MKSNGIQKLNALFLLLLIGPFSAYAQSVQMELNGSLKIHNEGETEPEPGTVRWSECDYEVWNGNIWVSLTTGEKSDLFAIGSGGPQNDISNSVIADNLGYIYITGSFKETAMFSDSILTSNGSSDIFLAKYSEDGDMVWIKQAGGSSFDNGTSITTDENNNIYLTGNFNDTAYFGSQVLITGSNSQIFLAKYDLDGTVLWAKQAGGYIYADGGRSVVTDQVGNICLTGSFRQNAPFGTINVSSHGGTDIFIAKYNPQGNPIWVNRAGGTSNDFGESVSTDIFGNVYVSGSFTGNANFETINLVSNGDKDIFLAKYSSEGALLWAKSGGSSSADNCLSVARDTAENIYVTGSFSDTAYFDNKQIISSGQTDIYLAKYNHSGSLLWINRAGGSSYDQGNSLIFQSNDQIYLTGSFRESAIFGNYMIPSKSNSSYIFLAKYNSEGDFLWVKTGGSNGNDIGNSVVYSKNNNIYVTGNIGGFSSSTTASFGANTFITAGLTDIFLVKYKP